MTHLWEKIILNLKWKNIGLKPRECENLSAMQCNAIRANMRLSLNVHYRLLMCHSHSQPKSLSDMGKMNFPRIAFRNSLNWFSIALAIFSLLTIGFFFCRFVLAFGIEWKRCFNLCPLQSKYAFCVQCCMNKPEGATRNHRFLSTWI